MIKERARSIVEIEKIRNLFKIKHTLCCILVEYDT